MLLYSNEPCRWRAFEGKFDGMYTDDLKRIGGGSSSGGLRGDLSIKIALNMVESIDIFLRNVGIIIILLSKRTTTIVKIKIINFINKLLSK